MTSKAPFWKYSALGNDFILFDDAEAPLPSPSLVSFLCNRKLGIGADGVLFLQKQKNTVSSMTIFNSDGSEAEMCGNGLRCAARHLFTKNPSSTAHTIIVQNQPFIVHKEQDLIRYEATLPKTDCIKRTLSYPMGSFTAYSLDFFVPHTLIFLDQIGSFDLQKLGRYVFQDPTFHPKGTNVSILERIDNTSFKIRTFERGVTEETMACGTAALSLTYLNYLLHKETKAIIYPLLNKPLYVSIEEGRIAQTGEAEAIFSGEIDLNREHKLNFAMNH